MAARGVEAKTGERRNPRCPGRAPRAGSGIAGPLPSSPCRALVPAAPAPPESFSKNVLASWSEFPYSTSSHGGVAQLGERFTGSQEVRGSNPLVSTTCSFLSLHGGVAQLGERLTGSQEVRGSIPLVSTMRFKARAFALAFLFAIFKILYISHSEMHVRIL